MSRRKWVTEASDEWLKTHQSHYFKKRRNALANAIAGADLGFLGAPKLRPDLKLPGSADSSYVRYTESQYAYTYFKVVSHLCPRCGQQSMQQHQMWRMDSGGVRQQWGHVSVCASCDRDSWMFVTHSRRCNEARRRAAMTVL